VKSERQAGRKQANQSHFIYYAAYGENLDATFRLGWIFLAMNHKPKIPAIRMGIKGHRDRLLKLLNEMGEMRDEL